MDEHQQQRKRDSKHEDHDAAKEGDEEVTGQHDGHDEGGGVALLQVAEGVLILGGADEAREHQHHHRAPQDHVEGTQEPHDGDDDGRDHHVVGLVVEQVADHPVVPFGDVSEVGAREAVGAREEVVPGAERGDVDVHGGRGAAGAGAEAARGSAGGGRGSAELA